MATREGAKTFQDLIVWQKAHGFVLGVYGFAQASLEECRYYLILAQDLNYGPNTERMNELEEVSRLLTRYAGSIPNSDS